MRFTSCMIRLPIYIYLAYRLFYLYNNCDITFLTVAILTHAVNFPCGRKPEHTAKNQRLSAELRLSSHESVARVEPTNSEIKGACML
jgi:hypothetical protein